jgi:hypothetical protein
MSSTAKKKACINPQLRIITLQAPGRPQAFAYSISTKKVTTGATISIKIMVLVSKENEPQIRPTCKPAKKGLVFNPGLI